MFDKIFAKKIIPEALIAYQSRIPDSIEVIIRESKDGGYWAEIKNLQGCITQAENGQELFSMVNDAILAYLDIPEEYIPYMPPFLPPQEVREKFKIKIPNEFLGQKLAFQRK